MTLTNPVLWSLLRFQVLRVYRSSTVATQIATTGLAALVAYIPIGGLLLLAGLGLPYVLREQGIDPVTAVESVILPTLFCAAPFVAYFHRQVQAPLPALLSRPVPRSLLANALTVVNALNVSMGVLTVLVVTYWSTGIMPEVSLLPAICWLVGGLAVVVGFHLVCQLLRLTLHHSATLFGAAGVALVAGTLADSFLGAAWISAGGAWLLAGVRTFDAFAVLAAVTGIPALAVVAHSWMRRTLYLDRILGDSSKRRPSRGFLRDLDAMIRTDLRLLLRNGRMRLIAATFLYMPPLALLYFELGTRPGKGYQIIFAGFWLAFANINYLGIAQRARNGFMDGLATRPVSFRKMTESVLRITDLGTLIGAAIAIGAAAFLLPVAYISVLIAVFLYIGGVVNGLCAVVSVLIQAPFEPQGGMFDFQGTPSGNQLLPTFLLNIGGIVPLGAILYLAPDITHWAVIAGIGGLGLAGIAARGIIIDAIARFHRRRRYTLMDNYRDV